MRKNFLSGFAAIALIAAASAAHSATMYVHDSSGNLGSVDTSSGNASIIGNMGLVMTDIAFDPSGNLFGITFTGLFSINPTTASSSFIGSHGVSGGNGLVFGNDGTLYASGNTTSNLFSLNTGTGTGTSIGNTGFFSSGDLAFVGSDLFLSSTSGELVSIDLSNPSASTAIGSFGVPNVFGIATDETSSLFAVADTTIYSVDPTTGIASGGVSFAGQGLGSAFGQSFFAELGANPGDDPSLAPVPLPAGLPLMLSGLLGIGLLARRKKAA